MNNEEKLIEAVKELAAKFDAIRWGWDGHCGSVNLVDEFVEKVEEITGKDLTS